MTEETLFEYARENGWDKLFELAKTNHTLPEIEAKMGRKIHDIEIRAMCALGLTQIIEKDTGGYALILTKLGLKLIENHLDT